MSKIRRDVREIIKKIKYKLMDGRELRKEFRLFDRLFL
jgi:phenylalanyl-tRNA synthetase alpha subunit